MSEDIFEKVLKNEFVEGDWEWLLEHNYIKRDLNTDFSYYVALKSFTYNYCYGSVPGIRTIIVNEIFHIGCAK